MKLNRKEWTSWCFQVAMLLQQNFLLQDVLEIVSKSRTYAKVKHLSVCIREDMIKGYSFSESLQRHCTKIESYIMVSINSGEENSTIEKTFHHLYLYLDRKNRLDEKLKSTSAYPLLILVVAIGLTSALLGFMVPLIQEIAQSLDTPLPENTRRIIHATQWVSLHRWWLMLGGALFAGFLYFIGSKYKYFIHSVWLYFPLLGEWIRKKDLWKFFSTFSLLLNNQVSAEQSLSIAAETLQNARLYEEISLTIAPIQQGATLSGSLHRFMLSSEYIYSLLKTGEESNRMAQNAQFISDALQNELYARYEQWVKLAEPALFIVIGMIILWMVFSAYLPMLSLFQWDMWHIP